MNWLIGGSTLIGLILLLAGSNKSALVDAAQNLKTQISDFKLHSLDLGTRTFDFKVTVTFVNTSQTIIRLSNLLVHLNIPVNNEWRTLAQSVPTGQIEIPSGSTTRTFRFSAPIAAEVYSLLANFLQGTTQSLQVVAYPQFAGVNLEPVPIMVSVNPKDITTNLLSNVLGLGLVPNNGKKIKGNPSRYNRFWPSLSGLKGNDVTVADGSTFRTLQEMKVIVSETLNQTAAIAEHLKRTTVEQTLRSVFKFANENFNYRLDTPGAEELREPLRSWKDREAGIDCDCYSILLSSILTNLGISHSFRKAKYNGSKNYSHIYVVAHANGTDYILDPVVGKWNTEHPPSKTYTEKVL